MAGTGDRDMDRFQKLLDEEHAWPAEYTFKFIVPEAELDRVKGIFGQVPVSVRPSRNGRYMSVTATMLIHSSDEIVAVYEEAGRIDGLIAL
ncbi:MAG: DUF493 domain-containing protein [Acidobacteriota bacterium]|nr:DUF493 domain-containing protein [Acidobacteriota bacterium]